MAENNSQNTASEMKRTPTQKFSPLQKKRLQRIAALVILVALAWLLLAPGSGLLALLRQRSELQKLSAETEELARENERLQAEIDRLQIDRAYLEEVARRDFGLLKPHERVYDFSKPESSVKND